MLSLKLVISLRVLTAKGRWGFVLDVLSNLATRFRKNICHSSFSRSETRTTAKCRSGKYPAIIM